MTRKPRWQDSDPRFREESARYERPVPSRELLLKTLADAREPLGFDALSARLGAATGERDPEQLRRAALMEPRVSAAA